MAHRRNNYLRNVKKLQVTADPFKRAPESNENNNTMTVPYTFPYK